jgi:hypothetical protein
LPQTTISSSDGSQRDATLNDFGSIGPAAGSGGGVAGIACATISIAPSIALSSRPFAACYARIAAEMGQRLIAAPRPDS